MRVLRCLKIVCLIILSMILLVVISFILSDGELVYLNCGYYYHGGGSKMLLCAESIISLSLEESIVILKKDIYSEVTDYDYNDDYIIAVQRPDVDLHIMQIEWEFLDNYTERRSNSIADSLVKNDPYYQKIFSRELNYWIISGKTDSLYGPYSKEEFLEARKVLGVPSSLEIE